MRICLLVCLLVLAGCGGTEGTGDKGYIDGKGIITRLPAAERDKPGDVSGETLDGEQVALSDYAGKVVVLNVWAAWCPPCRAEAPELSAAAKELTPQGVVFLGIDSRDSNKAAARAFERRAGTPYPSIWDPSGRTLLAFRGTLTPTSIPSTVIIDKQGRVAASILGEVSSKTTLVDIVEDVQGGPR